METKEKAKELIKKFQSHAKYWDCYNGEPLEENHAVLSAIICVNEIILSNPHSNPLNTNGYSTMEFWQEVKQLLINYEF